LGPLSFKEFGPAIRAKLRGVFAVLYGSLFFASAFKGCGYLPADASLGNNFNKTGAATVFVLLYSFRQVAGRADIVVGVSVSAVKTNQINHRDTSLSVRL